MLRQIMVVPNYTYLKMKMLGPRGIITVVGNLQDAYQCDRLAIKMLFVILILMNVNSTTRSCEARTRGLQDRHRCVRSTSYSQRSTKIYCKVFSPKFDELKLGYGFVVRHAFCPARPSSYSSPVTLAPAVAPSHSRGRARASPELCSHGRGAPAKP